MQKSLGPKSTALRRPLRILSGNKAQPPPESVRKHPPSADALPPESVRRKPHPTEPAATADAVLDRLLLARSDLAGIVSQIDELLSAAVKRQTMSTRGKQEIESFSGFLSNTNASLKQWSSRLKLAFETCPVKIENVSKQTLGMGSHPAVKGNGKMVNSSSNLPAAESVAMPSCSMLNCSNRNLPDDDMIVSPSPLVSWHTGACMVESGKQLFLLTPLSTTKECSSRCPTSKTQLRTDSSLDQLNLPNLPVWKLTIADEDDPDPEQVGKLKEAKPCFVTPHATKTYKGSLEDRSPCTFSVQKNMSALPGSCLKTTLSSDETTQGDRCSKACDDLSSSDEISKDLASRYDLYGFNQFSKNTHSRREADDTLQWFLSPLKTCVLMDPSDDDKQTPTPATIYIRGKQDTHDDNSIQTPLHSKALATPLKGLESTSLKGRKAGESTLKKELWTRFEAATTDELRFDKSLFQKIEGKRFLDMLEEAS